MTQNLIGNPVKTDAVIDLIKQKLNTVYQHVVDIAKKTLCLLDFFFSYGHQSQVLADRQMIVSMQQPYRIMNLFPLRM